MKKFIVFIIPILIIIHSNAFAQNFPVKGISISAPSNEGLDDFLKFVEKELVPRNINTIILRMGYNYEFKSFPKLRGDHPLTETQVKKIVKLCRDNKIKIIPLFNLLGHQSWQGSVGLLLKNYPEFDETPHVVLPKEYVWPNDDYLYCKSYCPLHPKVHEVVFPLITELVEVFETNAFHAGMDEVFYIGEINCPRCSGKDKAEIFAGEVTKIRNYLSSIGVELWIWGDRLLDGKTTGLGIWEASFNNTHKAIDLIPKDVLICDWHYEMAVPTAAIFAGKGLSVVSCPWRIPEVGIKQIEMMEFFRDNSTIEMKERFKGVVHTVWQPTDTFIKRFYSKEKITKENGGDVETFKTIFPKN